MKNETRIFVPGRLWSLFSRHWFKIGLVGLMLYAFLNKDFSFNIQIHAPERPAAQPEDYQTGRAARRETLTDNGEPAEKTGNRLDLFPAWSGGDSEHLILRLNRLEAEEIERFIERFSHVAETEQEKYGIPASIILANSLLHGEAGRHYLVKRGNNYFGLPCTDDWQGQTQDGEKGECLRRYDNAWMSFRDHSLYYTTGKNSGLRRLIGQSPGKWAHAMADAPDNATDKLAEQLLTLIDKFNLERFDG